eukprot:scaffold762_cov188-Prasinococcus_capsulatus_cf.AAC.1
MLAYLLAMTFNLSPALLAGLVLVGSINGGQASNLCTYIARGTCFRQGVWPASGGCLRAMSMRRVLGVCDGACRVHVRR